MLKVLVLPDGSAIESQHVKAITWDPSSPGQYGHKAFVRVYGYKASDGLFGGGRSGLEQLHVCRLDSDEEAKAACADLVTAWVALADKREAVQPPREPLKP